MQLVIGFILIILGVIMEILAILVWLGTITPAYAATRTLTGATPWDLLLELLRKDPWTAVVGLILIYAGLKMIGVNLPF